MKNGITVRSARYDDREKLAALLHRNYFNTKEIAPENEALINERLSAILTNSNDRALFLALDQASPVAYAYVIRDEKRSGLLVDDLYTMPEYEGQGIASALLRQCENFARDAGEPEIHLNVITDNAGLESFYEKRGWVKQSFNDTQSGMETDIDPHTYVPTHLMKKDLGPAGP